MNNAQEQELPFVYDIEPILDEIIGEPGQGPSEGESLKDWIRQYTQVLPIYFQRMSFGKVWDEMSLDDKTRVFEIASSNDMVSPGVLAGMIKTDHSLLKGFDDLHKRTILENGIEWESERSYFQTDDRTARYKEIRDRLGTRIIPTPDVSRK